MVSLSHHCYWHNGVTKSTVLYWLITKLLACMYTVTNIKSYGHSIKLTIIIYLAHLIVIVGLVKESAFKLLNSVANSLELNILLIIYIYAFQTLDTQVVVSNHNSLVSVWIEWIECLSTQKYLSLQYWLFTCVRNVPSLELWAIRNSVNSCKSRRY